MVTVLNGSRVNWFLPAQRLGGVLGFVTPFCVCYRRTKSAPKQELLLFVIPGILPGV